MLFGEFCSSFTLAMELLQLHCSGEEEPDQSAGAVGSQGSQGGSGGSNQLFDLVPHTTRP